MNELIEKLNKNSLFYAITMLLLNLGSRYIDIELTEEHKKLLSSPIVRRITIFCIVFMATRDIIISLIITCLFIILIFNLFNKNSKYCLLPKNFELLDINNDGLISKDEMKKFHN